MNSRSSARGAGRTAPEGRPRLRRSHRAASASIAIAVHLAILFLLVRSLPRPPVMREPDAVTVSLVAPIPVPTPPPRPQPPRPAASRASGPQSPPTAARPPPLARAAAPRRTLAQAPLPIPAAPAAVMQPGVSEAELAGAITAGSGAGDGGGEGRRCDMVRRLQAALRRDARVQAAAAEVRRAGPRAVLIWNGDWIQSAGEAGKGLAGVRQAISLEVAFAPEACRAQPVHGLVLITLNDAPGSARLVLGGGVWRWSDLLQLR